MSELTDRCLDTFPDWLRTLATDATELSKLLTAAELNDHEGARRFITGGLNYLFKSLDLIPDGIEDLGFLDDAFVLRVACKLAIEDDASVAEKAPAMAKLAEGASLIEQLLEGDYARLVTYVKGLTKGAARGRTVDEILEDEEVRGAFLNEFGGWASSYSAPGFTRDEKNIVKLQSFLSAKLPQ